MPSHRIHLRGPWDYLFNGQSGTVTMPKDWRALFGESTGRAQFRRKFHRPTNLDPHEQVLIVFTEIAGQGIAALNGTMIGEFNALGGLIEFEVTSLLQPFNELSVELDFDPVIHPRIAGGLSGLVGIEIRSE